ncbi:UNVERIFIED_CONTAM: hypothetical protein Sangu_0235000 [Sesamum angustifolium]|uniref:Uncharacterized protein n=1 Tax=Sesamum angustifolium TaxID=2727405 RepID=A0AAW2RND9_9LAMI
MGLFTYTVAGGGLILIGAWESLISSSEYLKSNPSSFSSLQSPAESQNLNRTLKAPSFSSTVTFLLISVLSLLSILNSFVSMSDAVNSKDNTGFALQLEVVTIAFLFLLYAVLGILANIKESFRFPLTMLNVIYAFAFGEEFLLFYTQNKDPSELKINLPKVGPWNREGQFTIKCKGHPEYHRGRAIATLQFNCHLALLVTLAIGLYSVFCKKNGINGDFMRYKPLGVEYGGEMHLNNQSQFTLDSDDDDDDDDNGIKEAKSVEMQRAIVVVPESTVNGYGSHP